MWRVRRWLEAEHDYDLNFDYGGFISEYEQTRGLSDISVHQLYSYDADKFKRYVRGVGEKRANMLIADRTGYIREHKELFCKCGEPKLIWAKYCPRCGAKMDEVTK